MRRLMTVAILAALVGTSAACGDSSDDKTASAPTTAATTATASPSPTVDLKANTKQVCTKFESIVTADAFKPIGVQLGLMIQARQSGNKAAETAAAAKAKELADGIAKQITDLKAEAADPKVQAALDKGAAAIQMFGSPDYLAKLNSTADINKLATDLEAAGKDIDTLCA
ncbi:hypothetical protein GCM10018962_16020 [Dactylosporangium matsuzakiense]|uniref:Small secreted protein n=2 Tax=Dactylosporangium matsuzakiense TaxID=53360 RepID=A0A9W6NM87_9ACTN|nr:hypothetical protein GCM10017581_037030 [Dactylosporangium matsuzakiense]